MKRIAKWMGTAALGAASLAAQTAPQDKVDLQGQIDRAMAQSKEALEKLQMPEMQDQLERAMEQAQKAMENVQLPQLDQLQQELQNLKIEMPDAALDELDFRLDGMLALGKQDSSDRAQEARERARKPGSHPRVKDRITRNGGPQ